MRIKINIWLIPKIFFMLALVWILFCTAKYWYFSFKKYYGYCMNTWQNGSETYGRKFSTEERLNLAIDYYLKHQESESLDYSEIARAESIDSSIDARLKVKLIPYSSRQEFLALNPACCELSMGLVEGDKFDFEERSNGKGNGMFIFTHKIRYTDNTGHYKTITSQKTIFLVNNCGIARGRFYF